MAGRPSVGPAAGSGALAPNTARRGHETGAEQSSSGCGAAERCSRVFRQLENLADDKLGRVGDQVAVEVEDLAGAAGISQAIAGDRPQCVVEPHLVDGPPRCGADAPGAGHGPSLGLAHCPGRRRLIHCQNAGRCRERPRPRRRALGCRQVEIGSVCARLGGLPSDEPEARPVRRPPPPGAALAAGRINAASRSSIGGIVITSPT